nr:hypothetical protein [Tanacetum cinerariifolium]
MMSDNRRVLPMGCPRHTGGCLAHRCARRSRTTDRNAIAGRRSARAATDTDAGAPRHCHSARAT